MGGCNSHFPPAGGEILIGDKAEEVCDADEKGILFDIGIDHMPGCLLDVGLFHQHIFGFGYFTHLLRASTSIGLSFQRLMRSSIRARKRLSCSLSLTENQYLTRIMPERTSIHSNSGQTRINSQYASSLQNLITCSTSALENDNDLQFFCLDPNLQVNKFHLQADEF